MIYLLISPRHRLLSHTFPGQVVRRHSPGENKYLDGSRMLQVRLRVIGGILEAIPLMSLFLLQLYTTPPPSSFPRELQFFRGSSCIFRSAWLLWLQSCCAFLDPSLVFE